MRLLSRILFGLVSLCLMVSVVDAQEKVYWFAGGGLYELSERRDWAAADGIGKYTRGTAMGPD